MKEFSCLILMDGRSYGLQMFKSAPPQTPRLVLSPLMFGDDGSSVRELGYWEERPLKKLRLFFLSMRSSHHKESLQLDPSWIVVRPYDVFTVSFPGTMSPSSTSSSVCKASQRPVTFIFSSLN